MDSIISGKMTAELIGGVSDINTANGDMLSENGMIILCRRGSAVINVNYHAWDLPDGGVITIFPGDVISVSRQSSDFIVDMLVYSPNILREASLDIEHSIYDKLREDRCRSDSQVVSDIVRSMFTLLGLYFRQSTCKCLDRLVLCQLKAFFIGFHDYISRFPDMVPPSSSSKRKRDLFNLFMKLIELNYRRFRDVNWYAGQLNISSKYLNIITKEITDNSAKTLIDHYVILKLKQELSGSGKSLKQLAWDYNFCDASFFTRYFRLHTGLTPRAWRLQKNPSSESASKS
ncbi:transcriptional regulator AraC family [Bacteroides sp. CAG:709]|nr:transcriptional regulator AraC family [Bacteroides sp. CAG:709]